MAHDTEHETIGETAVGYTRLSQEGDSLETQSDMIRRYADDRDLDLEAVYSDGEYASGYSAEREEYQDMLARLRSGDVEHVVVRGLSRLSRDRKHRMKLLLELDETGVDVHAVERGRSRNPVDLDEPWALTREAGQADADDVEKRKEAERGRAEADRREENGLPNGRPPRGLTYGPDAERFVVGDADEFERALEAIRLRDEGEGESLRAIADELGYQYAEDVRRVLRRRESYESAAQE